MGEYAKIRKQLKQIAQKVVEPGREHYRLYKCEKCGQLWQGTLSTIIDDRWYVFKVPEITKKEWLQKPYVCPDVIVGYLEDKNKYLSQNFNHKKERCSYLKCSNYAIEGSVYCEYHLFDNLVEKGMFRPKPKGREFCVYKTV